MRKICFYTDTVFTMGGIQRIVTNLCNSLCNDYSITIICEHNTKKKDKINYNLNNNIKVKIIDNNFIISDTIIFAPIKASKFFIRKLKLNKTKFGKKVLDFDYKVFKRKRLIRFFREEQFDYILAESLNCCLYLSKLKPKINSKIIGCWHSSYKNYLIDNTKEEIKKSIENLDNTIVLSKADVNLIKKDLNLNVDYIYNFISSKEMSFEKDYDKKILLTVGRYDKIKGYDRLIKIFNEFYKHDKQWKLLLVGDGLERKNLQNLINELHLNNNVILTGKTNNVEKYYKEASIFLFSSYGEGFPMVILEAMKYKLPIIAFDIPVLNEMLPSGEYIVEQNNQKKYLDLMKKLSKDNDLIEKIGKQNLEKCKEFYEEEIVKQWKELLK